jgi:hypothetical protein
VGSWQWDMYATQAGECSIPAFRLNYLVPVEDQSLFGQIWGAQQYARRAVYSNALPLEVQAMPAHAESVQAIGTIHAYSASLKPAAAREGEGIVLTLEIEGDMNMPALTVPQLQNMPAALKYYESKNYNGDAKARMSKKCFEYIVQGIKAGSWEIPPQHLTYFDTASRSYKKISTKPVTVTIVGAAQQEQVTHHNNEEETEQVGHIVDTDIKPLYTAELPTHEHTPLSLSLLLALLCIPLCVMGAQKVRKHMTRSGHNPSAAYTKAYAALQSAKKQNNTAALYTIFIEFFAAATGIPVGELSEEKIDNHLKKAHISAQELEQWHNFFANIAGLVFAGNYNIENQDMFKQADEWLALYKKKLL